MSGTLFPNTSSRPGTAYEGVGSGDIIATQLDDVTTPRGNTTKLFPNCTEILESGMSTIFFTPTNPSVYIGLAFLHITLLAITLAASSVALGLICRLSQHPSKLAFYWICLFCIIGPSSYALLMDFSLLFDYPAIGRCEKKWEGAIYWLAHSQFETALIWIFAFNAVLLYTSICRHTTTFSKTKVNAVLMGIVSLAFLESALWVYLTENYSAIRCKVRGSFCVTVFEGNPAIIVTLEYIRILLAFLPEIIAVPLCIILYWRKVKKSLTTINQTLARSLIHVSISLLVGTFLCNLPTMLIHFSTYHGHKRIFVNLISTYTLQFNYLLHPLLIIALHRDLREKVKEKIRRLLKLSTTQQSRDIELQEVQG